MDTLDDLINQLAILNGNIISNIDINKTQILQQNKNNLISSINKQCIILKTTIQQSQHTQYNNLIKKYLIVQQNHRDNELNMHAIELIMKDPTLTMDMAINKIQSGYDTNNILCLNTMEILGFVEQRHKEIIKLEMGIQEVNELFIAMHAIIIKQGEQINTIEDKIHDAKNSIKHANSDLNKAYKFKRKIDI